MNKELNKRFNNYLKPLRKARGTSCFIISNTSKKIKSFYFTPVRIFDAMKICGVVVANSLEAKEFASAADGKFDFIAVDSEKKIEPFSYVYPDDLGNIEGEVLDVVKISKIINFKANDITVNALDMFISHKIIGVPDRRISIVGVGNIGFKLAQKLVERGCRVSMFRRDLDKLNILARSINLVKPKGTLADAHAAKSLKECLNGAHVVIATADTSHIISLDDLKNTARDPLLIDCGKACFCDDVCASWIVYRTDVGMALLYQIKTIIKAREALYPKFGKRSYKARRYVCGISGMMGDAVLSDINDLNSVIGICDGEGGLYAPKE